MSNLKIRLVSPHLTIYKPQFNSIMSIFFRVSGFVLFISLLYVINYFFEIQGFSFFFFRSVFYVPSFILSIYAPWISSIFVFISLFSFYYHFIVGLDAFDFFRLRPLDYIKFDEFHLGQLAFIFKFKMLFIGFLTLATYFFMF